MARWALVTGANSGIGEALAEGLARRGRALILTARDHERLERVAARLRGLGVTVETVAADLGDAHEVERLTRTVAARGWEVDLLVNNAGLGSGGRFEGLEAARELEIVAVNVAAMVALTRYFLPRMLQAGGGAIVNVSSAAAFQPMPFMATYAASKAFERSFSLALWRENRDRGVHVMAVCPGTTDTRFFERAGLRRQRRAKSAAEVAAIALRALDERRPEVICGLPYRAMVGLERLLPRRWVVELAARYGGRGRT